LIISYINFARFRELIGAQKAIISSLAGLTEGRDPETGRHLERTRNYSVVLAKQLRKDKKYRKLITNEFIEDLYDAAPLHDIGKVGIRDAILLKESKLTSEEYEEMKKHAQIGKQVLRNTIDRFKLKQSFFIIGRNICAYHHEKYNGKGYLEGLKGQEIPLEARVFALCDAYDAIRSKRPYKDELSHEEALRRIKSDSGEHFDPDIVDAFLKCEKEFLKISDTYKD
jgi:putative two-component system response regulator